MITKYHILSMIQCVDDNHTYVQFENCGEPISSHPVQHSRDKKNHVYFLRTRSDSARFWQSPQGLKVCAPELFLLLCTLRGNAFLHTWQTRKRHSKHSHWFRSSLVSGRCFQCRLSSDSVQCLRLQTFAPPSPALRHVVQVLHCRRVHGGLQQSLHSDL